MGWGKLARVTEFVLPDEKAYALVEVNLTPYTLSKGGEKYIPASWHDLHRYQIVYVNRDDKITEYHADLGLASKWAGVGPLRILSYWEESVAQLKEMANIARSDMAWQRDILINAQGESTLVEDVVAQAQHRYERRKKMSKFGPYYKIQRV